MINKGYFMIQQPSNKSLIMLIMAFITLNSTPLLANIPLKSPGGFNLTQEQIDQMTKEFENIDKFFNSLPPEEQAEFLKQVEEAQKILSNMSEEELNQLVKEMEQYMPEVLGGLPAEAMNKPLAQPEKIKPLEIPTVAKTQKQDLSEKEATVLTTIDNLIKNINECIVKINSAPEIQISIERWGKKNKISGWPATKKWSELYHEFDVLAQKLANIKEKDSATDQFRHLKAVSEDQKLTSILQSLNTKLNQSVPKIIIPTFGIADMNKESKNELKNSISNLAENIIQKEIIKNIDAILQKFLPEAQKIKNTEEKIATQASRQAQTKPQPGKTVIAGKNEPQDDFAQYGNYYNGNTYSHQNGYYDSNNYGTNRSFSNEQSNKPNNLTSKQEAPNTSTSSSGTTKADQNKGTKSDQKNPHEKSITQIIDLLGDTADLINEDPYLSELEKHLKNKNQSISEKTVNALSKIDKNVTEIINKTKSFHRKIADLGELGKKHKNDLIIRAEKVKGPLIKLRNSISGSMSYKTQISNEKRYAYFKEEATISKEKQIPQAHTSLTELGQTIGTLLKTLNK